MREKGRERESDRVREFERRVSNFESREWQQQQNNQIEKEGKSDGHHVGEDNGWQVVRGRKDRLQQKRLDVARSFLFFSKNAPRTTYFFSNFPENFKAKHMLKAFLKFGDVEEVVIPLKRDKLGKRFGFVRTVNVMDPEHFGKEMDKLIIGREKIKVNLARFSRNTSVFQPGIISNPKPLQPLHHASFPILAQHQNHSNPNSFKTISNPDPKPPFPIPKPGPPPFIPKYGVRNNRLGVSHAALAKPSYASVVKQKPKQKKVWVRKTTKKPDFPLEPDTDVRPNQRLDYVPPKRIWAHRHFVVDDDQIETKTIYAIACYYDTVENSRNNINKKDSKPKKKSYSN